MRRYLIFAVAVSALLLAAIDMTAVAVAFPIMVTSFDISLIVASWVLNSYQLAVTAATPVSGKIADALGRKKTFLGFLIVFTVFSMLCSIAPNAWSLILFRLLQGLGGSGFMPSAAGIVADEFPGRRQQAIGLLTSIMPIGWIIGPNLGAWMTSVLGWRSIFWINVPIGVVAFVIAVMLMKKDESKVRTKVDIDLLGAGLFGGGLFALMAALGEIGNGDMKSSLIYVGLLLALSAGFLVAFWRRQNRVKNPIIDPEVLRQKPFVAANIYNFFYGWCIGSVSLVPLYAVSVYGMTIMESGLVLTPRSVGMMAAALLTSLSIARWGYRRPMLAGTTLLVVSLSLLALEPGVFSVFGFEVSSLLFLFVVCGFMGLCMGTIAPAANNACIELMPERVATITGIRVMFRQAGAAVAIAVGSLLLHSFGINRGFQFFFAALAAIQLLVQIPALLAMPRSATDGIKVAARGEI